MLCICSKYKFNINAEFSLLIISYQFSYIKLQLFSLEKLAALNGQEKGRAIVPSLREINSATVTVSLTMYTYTN